MELQLRANQVLPDGVMWLEEASFPAAALSVSGDKADAHRSQAWALSSLHVPAWLFPPTLQDAQASLPPRGPQVTASWGTQGQGHPE